MFKMLRQLFQQSRSQKNSRAINHQPARIEILEDKCLLASIVWDGGGATNNWSDADNWFDQTNGVDNIAPATGDEVRINLAGSYTVNLDIDIAAGQAVENLTDLRVNSSNATLEAWGRTVTVQNSVIIDAGTIMSGNTVWTGTGAFGVEAAGSLSMFDGGGAPSQIDLIVLNRGSILVRGLDNEFTNPGVINESGTLTIQTDNTYGDGVLTLSDGMFNQSAIILAGAHGSGGKTARLVSGSGTVENQTSGTIEVRRTSTGFLTGQIDAQLDNRGTITNATGSATPSSVQIIKVGVDHVNTGIISTTASNTTISGFNSFDNSGTITTNSNTLNIQGESQTTSTFANSGTLTSGSSTLLIEDLNVFSNAVSGVINVNAGASSIDDVRNVNTINHSGDLNFANNAFLRVTGGTLNTAAGSTINGIGTLHLLSNVVDVTGALTMNPNLLMENVHVTGSGSLTTVANTFMYDTTALPSQIDIPLTNAGSLLVRGVDNQINSSNVLNTGTITIQTLAGVHSTLTLSDGMLNQGDILLTSGNGSGGTFSRIISTSGTLVNDVAATIEVRRTSNGFLTGQIDAQLDNRGTINNATGSATPSSVQIIKVGADHVNTGIISTTASNTTISGFNSFDNSGTITTNSNTLNIQGESQTTSTFANSGTLTSGSSTLLIEDLNVFSNAVSGVINVNAGASSIDDVRNVNTINHSGDLNFANNAFLRVTGGTLNTAAGSTINGIGTLHLLSNVVDVTGALTMNPNLLMENVHVTGSGSLTTVANTFMYDTTALPSQIDIPLTNAGSLLVRGIDNQLNSSNVLNTGTITIQTLAGVHSTLTLSDGMLNQGDILLTSGNGSGGTFSRIISTSGTLVNDVAATIEVRRTSNGFLTGQIGAQLDNRGTITNATGSATPSSVQIIKVGADHVNTGIISTTASNTTISGFNSFDNSGTITTNSNTLNIQGESQTTSTFANSGTLTSGSSTLLIEDLNVFSNAVSGVINVNAGASSIDDVRNVNTINHSGDLNFANNAFLRVTGGTLNTAAGSTINGVGTLHLLSNVVDVTGALTMNPNLLMENVHVTGSGSLTTVANTFMYDNIALPSQIDIPLTNAGSLLVRGVDNQINSSNVLNTGTITIQTLAGVHSTLTLSDGMLNQGDILLTSGNGSGGTFSRIISTSGTLVNDVAATIEVRRTSTGFLTGQIDAQLDNRGTITNATGSATPSSVQIIKVGADHVNTGVISTTASNSTISGFNSFDNSGTIDSGTRRILFAGGGNYIHRTSGVLLSTIEAEFNNVARVSGVGTIGTKLQTINSNVDPGLSPGILNVMGNFDQSTGSSLSVEIGGDTAGNGTGFHDQVDVTGTVTIGSNVSLNTTASGGYVPAGGDSYVIINNDSTDLISGTFSGLPEGAVISTNFLGSGETATISYAGGTDNNDVVISIVDITPPVSPATPDLDAGSDSGVSDSDDYTNIVLPTFVGTAEAGSTVEVFSDVAGALGTVNANASTGAWSLTIAVSLADGIHNITATATDSSGNVSPASTALAVTVDTSNPGIPVVTAITDDTAVAGDGITSDNTLVISGTADSGVSIEVFDDAVSIASTTSNGAGVWSADYTATVLADGTYDFTAVAVDLAGNVSLTSSAFVATIDTAPPAVSAPDLNSGSDTGVSNSDDVTADNTPTVSGTAEASAEIEVFDGSNSLGTTIADGSGNWTFTSTLLPDGLHNLSATASDIAGSMSTGAALAVLIDTSPPAAPSTPDLDALSDTGDSDSDDITADTTPTISGMAEPGSTVEVFDGAILLGTTMVDGMGNWVFTTPVLGNGVHSLSASSTDAAGNAGSASAALEVSIDTEGPTVLIDRAVGQPDTATTSPVNFEVNFSEATTTFDSSDVAVSGTAGATTAVVTGSGTTYNVEVSGMTEGGSVIINIVTGVASDLAGNLSASASIIDNEVTFGDAVYDFAAASFLVNETDATFTSNIVEVSRSGNTSIASSVNVVLTSVDAIAGTDFVADPITLNFAVGETSRRVPIEILGDATVELNEAVALSLAGFSGTGQAGVSQATAILEITNDDSASVSVIGVAQAESDGGQTAFLFNVTLSEQVDTAVSLRVNTADDSAMVADNDYVSIADQTRNFAPAAAAGPQSQTVSVLVNGDLTIEEDEAFDLVLSSLSAGGRDVTFVSDAATQTAVGTIENDDSSVATISANVSTAAEGGSDGQFIILLSQPSDSPVEVGYSIGGTAGNGTDYAWLSGVVTFAANQTTATVDVEVDEDLLLEGSETVVLTLTSATSGISIGGGNSDVVTISDNEGVTVEFVATASGLTEATAGPDVLLQLVGAAGVTLAPGISVSADVIDGVGSAAVGSDYQGFGTQTAIFGPGSAVGATQIVTIAVLDDGIVEPTETVSLLLDVVNGTGATVGGQNTHTASILDDDTLTVEFNQATGIDSEANGGNLPTLIVSGDVQAGHSVSVEVGVIGGTATPADYSTPATLNVSGGNYANFDFAIPSLSLSDDGVVEPSETIQLGSITGSAIAVGPQSTTTYTIADDDTLTVEFNQSIGSDTETSGANLPQLLLTGDIQTGHSVSVDVSVIGGTATAADFAGPAILTVGPGTYAAQPVAIPNLAIVSDSLVEPSETVELGSISGSAVTAGTIGSSSYTITDDDTLTVEFNQTVGSDLEADGGNLPQILVSGEVQTGHSVSVDVAITGGTATAGDFVAPTTLLIETGSYVVQSFTIPSLAIIDDAAVETDETIELGGLTGSAVIAGIQATSTFTILDDDTSQSNDPPVITGLTSSSADIANKSDDGVVTVNGTFEDVNLADVHLVTVDWGDGSALESIAVDQQADSFNVTHSYNDGGIYSITVTVDDGNNGIDSQTTSAVVQGVGLVDGKLYIISSNGHDWVKVREHGGLLHADLRLNGHRHNHHRHWQYQSHTHKHFNTADVNEIVVFSCDGHDGIDVWASSGIPVIVDAGKGHDSVWTAGGDDTVLGGEGNDYIRTYGGNDTIDAGDGNNVVHSGGGDDSVTTGNGNDCIHTESGEDVIDSGAGNDWIHSGDGDDIVFAGAGNDTVYAGDGNDIVFGGTGNDHIDGGNGHDLLFGGAGKDYLNGGRGHDILVGGDGRDTLCGGKGNDLLIGGILETDWRSVFDESLLDTAIAEWATGNLADTMNILGNVLDDDHKDYLFGQQECDTLIRGNRDRWRQ